MPQGTVKWSSGIPYPIRVEKCGYPALNGSRYCFSSTVSTS
jgi:hypothetical protein